MADYVLSPSEISRLLCPNPYTCGERSNEVPREIDQMFLSRGIDEVNFLPEEDEDGLLVFSRCEYCDRLCVRMLNGKITLWKLIYFNARSMCTVPGVSFFKKNVQFALFTDAMAYATQQYGVKRIEDFAFFGSPPDVPGQFPVEKPKRCANCDKVGDSNNLRKCQGTCGGVVAYCNAKCQLAHWKKAHKLDCSKPASPHLSLPNPKTGGPAIPLVALHQLDGFRKSGLALYYSDHLGKDALKPHVLEVFGEVNEENIQGILSKSFMYAIPTNPVHNIVDRATLRDGEACFNTTKNGHIVEALLKAGIIKKTGRKLDMGFYKNHPICRINLPFSYKEEEEGE